jgi:hypothetical protein
MPMRPHSLFVSIGVIVANAAPTSVPVPFAFICTIRTVPPF